MGEDEQVFLVQVSIISAGKSFPRQEGGITLQKVSAITQLKTRLHAIQKTSKVFNCKISTAILTHPHPGHVPNDWFLLCGQFINSLWWLYFNLALHMYLLFLTSWETSCFFPLEFHIVKIIFKFADPSLSEIRSGLKVAWQTPLKLILIQLTVEVCVNASIDHLSLWMCFKLVLISWQALMETDCRTIVLNIQLFY